MLSKLKIYAPRSIIKSAYHAFITPHINYGLLNWGKASNATLSPIIKCLEKANSIVNSLDNLNSDTKNIFTFEDLHKLSVGKFMWKLHNGMLPASIKAMFKFKPNHNTVTRENPKFELPNPEHESKRRFITFFGLKMWKAIKPTELKDSKSIEIFTRKLKLSLKS